MNAITGQIELALGAGAGAAGFAALTNMGLGLKTYLDCADAGPGMPRMGVVYGPTGFGKSVSMAFTAQRCGAAYVEAKSIWTQRSFLEAVAEELGIAALARSAPKILDQIIDQLNREPRGLIVDEMDHLVRKQHVEIIRDIHDATTVPILLVGEEALPNKLRPWERFHNRILVFTAAQRATLDDARKLRTHYCPRVEIGDDLVARTVEACNGVTRRIVINLKTIERAAIEDNVDRVDLEWWGARPFLTGDVQARRLAA